MLDSRGVIYLPDIFIVQGLERKLIWCVQFLGGVHLPLVSICAIDPVVGVVVWQESLLA